MCVCRHCGSKILLSVTVNDINHNNKIYLAYAASSYNGHPHTKATKQRGLTLNL